MRINDEQVIFTLFYKTATKHKILVNNKFFYFN